MCTDAVFEPRPRPWALGSGLLCAALLGCAAGGALAQTPAKPKASATAAGAPAASPSAPVPQPMLSSPLPPGAMAGSGPGVHSPNSPFAVLPVRDDVVPWSTLTQVSLKKVGKRLLPDFPANVRALHGTTVRVQGFMTPLAPGEKQSHFLLSSVPLTCAFCTPGGPESMVEVKTRRAVRYSMEGVVVEGRLQVLEDDPQGLFYRLTDGVQVP
ncbi:DUF3299 domain-containing protein [Hydrogenophaga soli]